EAVPLLQAALAEPPTTARPQLLAELGRLLARTGQQAAAVPVLEQLLAESPESSLAPDAALNLARARLELRQPEAARATLQRLLATRRARGRAPAPVAPAVKLVSNPVALLAPEPHYRKAEALVSAGFDLQGLAELDTLGATVVTDPDRAWGLAIAFSEFGELG